MDQHSRSKSRKRRPGSDRSDASSSDGCARQSPKAQKGESSQRISRRHDTFLLPQLMPLRRSLSARVDNRTPPKTPPRQECAEVRARSKSSSRTPRAAKVPQSKSPRFRNVNEAPRAGQLRFRTIGTCSSNNDLPQGSQEKPLEVALNLLNEIKQSTTDKDKLCNAIERYNNYSQDQAGKQIAIKIMEGLKHLINSEFKMAIKVLQEFVNSESGLEDKRDDISGAEYLLAIGNFRLGNKFDALKLLVQRSRRPEIPLEIDADKLHRQIEKSIVSDLIVKANQSGSSSSSSVVAGCSTSEQQKTPPVCKHQVEFLQSFIQDPASSYLRSLNEAVPVLEVIGTDEKEYKSYLPVEFELEEEFSNGSETFDPNHARLLTLEDKNLLQNINSELQKTDPSAGDLEELFGRVNETSRYMALLKATWLIARGKYDKATRLLDGLKPMENTKTMLKRAIAVRRGLMLYLDGNLKRGIALLEKVASAGSLDAVIWLEKLSVDKGKLRKYSEWAMSISMQQTGPGSWHIAALLAIILNTKGSDQKTCYLEDYEDTLHRIVLSCNLTSKAEYLLLARAFAITYSDTRVCVLTRISNSETFLKMVGKDETYFALLEPIAMGQTTKSLIPICDGKKLSDHLKESQSSYLLSAIVDRINHQQEMAEQKILHLLQSYDKGCCALSGIASCVALLECFKQFCTKICNDDCA